jgi:hypothetical protein
MTGITPEIAAMHAAREEFDDLVRNLDPMLVRKIQDRRVSDEDRKSTVVQKAIEVWSRCSFELDDGYSANGPVSFA